MVMQAQDTFVAVLGDGTERFVAKGDVLPDGHELVKRDQAGAGVLFRPLDLGEDKDEKPAKARGRGRAAAPAEALAAEAPAGEKAK